MSALTETIVLSLEVPKDVKKLIYQQLYSTGVTSPITIHGVVINFYNDQQFQGTAMGASIPVEPEKKDMSCPFIKKRLKEKRGVIPQSASLNAKHAH